MSKLNSSPTAEEVRSERKDVKAVTIHASENRAQALQ